MHKIIINFQKHRYLKGKIKSRIKIFITIRVGRLKFKLSCIMKITFLFTRGFIN